MTGVRAGGLFNIPLGAPFCSELAKGLRARFESPDDPFWLTDCLIFVPNRRTARTVERAFAAGEPQGGLLPRIHPLGDWDPEDLENAERDSESASDLMAPALPLPVSNLERQLTLMQMVEAMQRRTADASTSPALALAAAQQLAKLLDAAALEGVSWDKLGDLVPHDLAEHWQQTLQFLTIVTSAWPQWLESAGLSDPGHYRNASLVALSTAWRLNPPQYPVIIAGSTGSVPATADLMRTVLRLPKGAVILPGVDASLEEGAWAAIGPDHPQFTLKQLLERLGQTRSDLNAWTPAQGHLDRAKLLSEVMRPADAAQGWITWVASARTQAAALLRGLSVIEAPNPVAEALSISLCVREALETPGASVALITPNRTLARRVATELERWGIEVDDSAGRPLSKTKPGSLLSLILAAVVEDFAPVPLLAMLKHPHCALGLTRVQVRRLTIDLELACLRGARPDAGLEGLAKGLSPRDREILAPLLEALAAGMAPLLEATGALGVSQWAERLRDAALAVSTQAEGEGGELWQREAGEAARLLLEDLGAIQHLVAPVTLDAFATMFCMLMDGVAVREANPDTARLVILGPLEARLQSFDVVILSGLNEPGWPDVPAVDGWLNRPMRQGLGMNLPERRIGQSAHDFCQALGASRVILTRAAKEEGGLAKPSRWLVRLDTLAKALGQENGIAQHPALNWAQQLDVPAKIIPGQAPQPKPPVPARPRKLAVTHIEQWVRDPYAFYVRHILRLRPLDPIDADPTAGERGTFIHTVLERFVRAYPKAVPGDAAAILLQLGREVMTEHRIAPAIAALWWPRFEAIASWIATIEPERRAHLTHVLPEVEGALMLGDLKFQVTAKADRLEVGRDGTLAIVDYKTGAIPSDPQMQSGLSPQLPLEGAIAQAGGFNGVEARAVRALIIMKLAGKRADCLARPAKDHLQLIQRNLEGLIRRIRAYDDPEQPYESRTQVQFGRIMDDYAYIARAAERFQDEAEGD